MLDDEIARQERLRAALLQDPATAMWVEPDALFTAYKALEFFDTLALWWQLTHHQLRQPATFSHVPVAIGEDATIEVTPTATHSARLAPFPFAQSPVRLRCKVRSLYPVPLDADFGAAVAAGPEWWQSIELTA
jgi:hypothetical protein